MNETWLFVDSGSGTPAFNMAMDEALLNWHSEGKIPPVLRMYGWEPAGISVGFFQKIEGSIDTDEAGRRGIPLVRRQTGGKAVLHDEELTYSILVSEAHPAIPKPVKEAYLVLSKGLLEGYRFLGIDAEFAVPPTRNASLSAVCFEEPSWYELTVAGRKVAGSAQTRKKEVVLQHGSVPLVIDDEKLFSLFRFPDEVRREKARNAFRSRAAAISELAGRPVTFEEAKTAFREGFERGLGIRLQPFDPPPELLAEAGELERKYGSDEWTYIREKEGERLP
ncbi:lipoate--protein ligase family protein [Indiicoccus explosivorum]|uniref:lipoate--protein ligase family protein n=1 Tax=Indiicoccus explosivorum TaxID=1917864 RepID=UPI000B45073F|nr:lipoate--protein ligase family protein [Indiicoccus explosivorum]